MCKPERHAHRVPILGDTWFKFINTSSNNQDSTVSITRACSHVFDKACVLGHQRWSHNICWSRVSPERYQWWYYVHIQFSVSQEPVILEGAFLHLSIVLLKFFDGSFVDPITFVDQMDSSGKIARIYVFNDDDVNMSHFISYFGLDLVVVSMTPLFW